MPGLSILIPVYNYSVEALVTTLSSQLTTNDLDGEIIILDDGSSAQIQLTNQRLAGAPSVVYKQNPVNMGRMATRQTLASLAKHSYLLFIDADSVIENNDFLVKYFRQAVQNAQVVSGGRVYQKEKPGCEFMLHWKYGMARESHKTGRPAFMSNNFLVKKELFLKLDQTFPLQGYGHEDSWWGIQFEKAGVECFHIDNPVVHGSLESSADFLVKSEQALENLIKLEQVVDQKLLEKHIRIYRTYRKLKSSGFLKAFLFFEKKFHSTIKKNLVSCRPGLFYFDLYRLGELIRKKKLGR